MRVELGARVRTTDGKDVGTIDRLIVDPSNNEIKAAVIRKGMIQPRDVEVPLSAMEPGPDGSIRPTLKGAQRHLDVTWQDHALTNDSRLDLVVGGVDDQPVDRAHIFAVRGPDPGPYFDTHPAPPFVPGEHCHFLNWQHLCHFLNWQHLCHR